MKAKKIAKGKMGKAKGGKRKTEDKRGMEEQAKRVEKWQRRRTGGSGEHGVEDHD